MSWTLSASCAGGVEGLNTFFSEICWEGSEKIECFVRIAVPWGISNEYLSKRLNLWVISLYVFVFFCRWKPHQVNLTKYGNCLAISPHNLQRQVFVFVLPPGAWLDTSSALYSFYSHKYCHVHVDDRRDRGEVKGDGEDREKEERMREKKTKWKEKN